MPRATILVSLALFVAPLLVLAGLEPRVDKTFCQPGYFFDTVNGVCDRCEPGTYSIGGGIRIDTWDDDWMEKEGVLLRSFCSSGYSLQPLDDPSNECEGWIPQTNWLRTQDLEGLHDVTFILEFEFNVVQQVGHFMASYMSITELHEDGLRLQVDSHPISHLSNTASFQPISISLNKGGHSVRFIFYKNPTSSEGLDHSRIKDVMIQGIKYADNECTSCSVGYYQPFATAAQCAPCPEATVSENEMSTSCHPCTSTSYASGNSRCIDIKRPCNSGDYHYILTPCYLDGNTWKAAKRFYWNHPFDCNSQGQTLPSETVVDCDVLNPCPPGFLRGTDNTKPRCQPCPLGTWGDLASNTCKGCPAGSSAIPELTISAWNNWADLKMTTGCEGDCTVNGWQLYSNFTSNEGAVNSFGRTWIEMTVNFLTTGSVTTTYKTQKNTSTASFLLIVDEMAVELDATAGTRQARTVHVTAGAHTLRWEYIFNPTPDAEKDDQREINIFELNFTGIAGGSAKECSICVPGTFQPSVNQPTCIDCNAGETSPANSTVCSPCPEGTFSDSAGSPSCQMCPEGMSSKEGQSYCISDTCIFSFEGHTYDYSPYKNYKTVIPNAEFTGQFTISFCDRLIDGPCAGSSFVCEQFSNFNPSNPDQKYLSAGSEIQFFGLPDDPITNQPEGVQFVFVNGDSAGCPDGVTRSTTVTIYCSVGMPVPLKVVESAELCSIEMEAYSSFGCPLCHLSDFERQNGPCYNGSREVTFIKRNDSICNGQVPTIIEKCSHGYEDALLLTAAAIGVVVVIATFSAIMFHLYQKNKKLSFKYDQLLSQQQQNQQRSIEPNMQELETL
eukprot:TRINITY_DN6182_c0_g1_i1.p1 TRINITY_DN6182_c0_g1~~TRINITY_DN6182_c0_g1_i1.p1  ORF type:complete len:839 (+),score=168.58 TRINITY_DN6182_c0_g1_i1:24-2540(+)